MPTAYQPPPVSSADTVKTLAFPFQRGPSGFPALADPKRVAFYKISSLLLTAKGERVMNPDYGVEIHNYVFDNLTPITAAKISSAVVAAIQTWIPEVTVLRVVPTLQQNNDKTQSTIILEISYRVANQAANMQVPINVGTIQSNP